MNRLIDAASVTVIIPAHNEQAAIVPTVRRLLTQRHAGVLDVVVVDDGSLDDTYAIARNTFAAEPSVRVLTKRHGGRALALNLGLSRARGEIIVVVDPGTLLETDTIHHFITALENGAAGVVVCPERGPALGRARDMHRAVLRRAVIASAWRAQAIHLEGGFSGDTLSEEHDLMLAVRHAGWRVEVTGDDTVCSEWADAAWQRARQDVRRRVRQQARRWVGALQCAWKHRRRVRHASPQTRNTSTSARTIAIVSALTFASASPSRTIEAQATPSALRGLPLTEVPATHGKTLAIFWSGDGGWKELASTVSTDLAAQGVAVVGVNSRSWLTSATRRPEDAAAATTALLRTYLERWHRDRVLLIGFSRGAGFLPFIYNGLPADLQSRVDLLAMLGMEPTASFEFHLIDLVRTVSRPSDLPVAAELARIAKTPLPMLCMYGQDESGSLCPSLDAHRYVLAARAGDHHFDRAYDQIAQQLLHAAGR